MPPTLPPGSLCGPFFFFLITTTRPVSWLQGMLENEDFNISRFYSEKGALPLKTSEVHNSLQIEEGFRFRVVKRSENYSLYVLTLSS